MNRVEVIEKYRNGRIYQRTINGVPIPVSHEEKEMVKFVPVFADELPRFIEEHRMMTMEEADHLWPAR